MMGASGKSGGKQLSHNLLQMKFMKRTREKQIQDQDHEERHSLFKSAISEAMRTQGDRFILEPSYSAILRLSLGRQAFQDMNPEVTQLSHSAGDDLADESGEREIDDMAMAHLLAKPAAGQRKTTPTQPHPPHPPHRPPVSAKRRKTQK